MNQLQVLKKLIPIYTSAINRIADGEYAEGVLTQTKTAYGICWCAYENNIEYIFNQKWVKDCADKNYLMWYKECYNDFPSAIECLSYRLTIMQLMVEDLTK